MTTTASPRETPATPRLVALLAEFDSVDELLSAARRVRDAGYERWDAHAPFPVHGLDDAMAIRPTRLPWLVFVAGVAGCVAALVFQWWTNAIAYPFLISGKPLFSLPANIPVSFEVTILLSAFAAFFGMFALNGLPRWSNPLLRVRRFRQATQSKFFIAIDAADARFSPEATRDWLASLGPAHIDEVRDDGLDAALPKPLVWGALIVAALALVPPVMIAKARVTTGGQPRYHPFFDMDAQPNLRAQQASHLFADGRAARMPVAGTIARGELFDDTALYLGQRRLSAAERQEQAVAEAAADPNQPPADVPPRDGYAWVETLPVPVSERLMLRGQQRFNIYCAPCHGLTGNGEGVVSVRALELQQGTWVPPTSLHAEHVRQQPVGQWFNTITHGVRKMPGYGEQLSAEDRWAVILYMQALQRSQDARPADVPPDVLPQLQNSP